MGEQEVLDLRRIDVLVALEHLFDPPLATRSDPPGSCARERLVRRVEPAIRRVNSRGQTAQSEEDRGMGKTHRSISRFLFYDLAAAHRKLHVSLNKQLKELDVQVETWRVLETLSSDEGLTMGELAEIVLMNPPTLTKLVDRMVANGLVHRQLAPEDHRRVHLVLTNAGLELIGKVRRHVEAQHEDILERLGEENARIVQEALRNLS